MKVLTDFRVRCIEHCNLTGEMLRKIINLKMQHWKYPEAAQKKWIEDNIRRDEYHLCLEDCTGHLLGYLNLVHLPVKMGKMVEEITGVGNVCVDKLRTGEGIGSLLMQLCNYYVSVQKRRGVLLCKKELSGFYRKVGWVEFHGPVILRGTAFQGSAMFNRLPDAESLEIERNF